MDRTHKMRVTCTRPWLTATFAQPHRMVSWSLNKPGFTIADTVAWLEVQNEELIHVADPTRWFQDRLESEGLEDAVGLITARNVARHEFASVTIEGIRSDCLITLGLNNGEAVGQRNDAAFHPLNAGTINILVAVSVALTDGALLEMSSIATQARTAALLRFGYKRPGMTEIVTGTGTDCIVAAAPFGKNAFAYAGMHTAIGEAVGGAVMQATDAAARVWLEDWYSWFPEERKRR